MEQAKALKLNVSQAAEQGIEAAITHAMGQASSVHVVSYN
jgi:post-segregation antitoxin (ccd killing protein)